MFDFGSSGTDSRAQEIHSVISDTYRKINNGKCKHERNHKHIGEFQGTEPRYVRDNVVKEIHISFNYVFHNITVSYRCKVHP